MSPTRPHKLRKSFNQNFDYMNITVIWFMGKFKPNALIILEFRGFFHRFHRFRRLAAVAPAVGAHLLTAHAFL